METMRLRAIQLPGNAGALLESASFVRPDMNKNKWQRCNE